jgi:hypothetical protein
MASWRIDGLIFAAVAALASGCGLVIGLESSYHVADGGLGGGGGLPVTCTVASQCDDQNPCTEDRCSKVGLCEWTKLDGIAGSGQKAGDCKTVKCVAGEATEEPDDNDILDDHEACTIDSCNAGVPSNTSKVDGVTCDLAGSTGVCTNGKCTVACKGDGDCLSKSPCSTPSCDVGTGTCVYTPLSDGTLTPGVTQKVGDCNINECVNGMPMDVPDDSDVPVTATDCDLEVCKNGVASNPAKPADTQCNTFNGSMAGRCDGDAATPTCRECAADIECHGPDPTDNCQARQCVNHACGPYPASGTAAAAQFQTAGDCQKVICDGNGGHMIVPDTTDPLSDGNVCTADVCSGAGTTTNHTPTNQGVQCGATASIVCNATGQCGCQTNADCTLPQTCGGGNPGTPLICGCTKKTCVQAGATCGTPSDGCGAGTINCNDGVKNGGESDVDCGGTGQCPVKCANGKTCTQNTDCTSNSCADGFCCDVPCSGLCQACSTAKKGSGVNGVCGAIKAGTDPDMECTLQAACAQNGFCDGTGACQLFASGTTCVQNFCTGTVLSKTDTCNGSGTCVDAGTQDCAPYLCSGPMGAAACTTTCASDAGCAPAATTYCAGNACLARKVQGSVCGAAHECLSNFCADGFCCDTACNGTCMACSAALKQSAVMNGTCGAAKDGTDPHSTCPAGTMASCGNDGKCQGGACEKWNTSTVCVAASCSSGQQTAQKTCDGAGSCAVGGATMACTPYTCGASACNTTCTTSSQCAANFFCISNVCQKKPDGNACGGDAECAGGHCADGVCCNTPCTGTCVACNLAGSIGTCSNVPSGNTDTGTCASPKVCSGSGACLDPNGTACAAGATCLSGNCADGVCCDTACTLICKACSAAAKGSGADGTCGNIDAFLTDSAPACDGTKVCNGAGACKLDSGQLCGLNSACASGACVGGICD